MFDGRYGRLMLLEAAGGEIRAEDALMLLLKHDGPDAELQVGERSVTLDRDSIGIASPGNVVTQVGPDPSRPARLLVLLASTPWLAERFPVVFSAGGVEVPVCESREVSTAHIRRLADALIIEILNDRFLAADRLEFMAQELMLSIIEHCLTQRRPSPRMWEGSRLEDSRMRRAVALLRERPTKELDIDRVASRVGLSRSRFYDLFQVCTGRSPRAYLDMLCLGKAMTALAAQRVRIADLSQELGFSAQSNFTRFFLNHVGIPPSQYRRAARAEHALEREPTAAPDGSLTKG